MCYLLGLNHLNGFNVSDFDIKLRAEPDGTNMLGTVVIPNPTVMTIEMVTPFFPLQSVMQLFSLYQTVSLQTVL